MARVPLQEAGFGVKPPLWDAHAAGVAPEWRWVWKHLIVGAPMLESAITASAGGMVYSRVFGEQQTGGGASGQAKRSAEVETDTTHTTDIFGPAFVPSDTSTGKVVYPETGSNADTEWNGHTECSALVWGRARSPLTSDSWWAHSNSSITNFSSENVRFRIIDNTATNRDVTVTDAVTANEFAMLGLTYGTDFTLQPYKNGVPIGTASTFTNPLRNSSNISHHFGSSGSGAAIASVTQCLIFSRALAAEEVLAIYRDPFGWCRPQHRRRYFLFVPGTISDYRFRQRFAA